MAKNEGGIQMPGVFGGLMRYDEEYNSRFMMGPAAVIGFIILIVVLVLILKMFFPTNIIPSAGFGAVLGLLG